MSVYLTHRDLMGALWKLGGVPVGLFHPTKEQAKNGKLLCVTATRDRSSQGACELLLLLVSHLLND